MSLHFEGLRLLVAAWARLSTLTLASLSGLEQNEASVLAALRTWATVVRAESLVQTQRSGAATSWREHAVEGRPSGVHTRDDCKLAELTR